MQPVSHVRYARTKRLCRWRLIILKDVPCRFQTSNKSCCFLLESERNASQSFPAVSGLFYHAVLSFCRFTIFMIFWGFYLKKKSIFLFAGFLMNRVVVCRISNNRLFLAWIFLFGYSRLTGWVSNLVQVMEATDYVTEFKRSLVPVYRYHHVNRSNCGISIFLLNLLLYFLFILLKDIYLTWHLSGESWCMLLNVLVLSVKTKAWENKFVLPLNSELKK